MRILIDENLPRQLKQMLAGHRVLTVQDMGWTGMRDDELLKKVEASFEVFLTTDKDLQQRHRGMRVVLMLFPSSRWSLVEERFEFLKEALPLASPGSIVEL